VALLCFSSWFWQVAAVLIAGILLAGEISESMGRQYRKNYLE